MASPVHHLNDHRELQKVCSIIAKLESSFLSTEQVLQQERQRDDSTRLQSLRDERKQLLMDLQNQSIQLLCRLDSSPKKISEFYAPDEEQWMRTALIRLRRFLRSQLAKKQQELQLSPTTPEALSAVQQIARDINSISFELRVLSGTKTVARDGPNTHRILSIANDEERKSDLMDIRRQLLSNDFACDASPPFDSSAFGFSPIVKKAISQSYSNLETGRDALPSPLSPISRFEEKGITEQVDCRVNVEFNSVEISSEVQEISDSDIISDKEPLNSTAIDISDSALATSAARVEYESVKTPATKESTEKLEGPDKLRLDSNYCDIAQVSGINFKSVEEVDTICGDQTLSAKKLSGLLSRLLCGPVASPSIRGMKIEESAEDGLAVKYTNVVSTQIQSNEGSEEGICEVVCSQRESGEEQYDFNVENLTESESGDSLCEEESPPSPPPMRKGTTHLQTNQENIIGWSPNRMDRSALDLLANASPPKRYADVMSDDVEFFEEKTPTKPKKKSSPTRRRRQIVLSPSKRSLSKNLQIIGHDSPQHRKSVKNSPMINSNTRQSNSPLLRPKSSPLKLVSSPSGRNLPLAVHPSSRITAALDGVNKVDAASNSRLGNHCNLQASMRLARPPSPNGAHARNPRKTPPRPPPSVKIIDVTATRELKFDDEIEISSAIASVVAQKLKDPYWAARISNVQ